MGDPQPLLLGLTMISYVVLIVNVALFGTYSILGFNRGLVTNALDTVTTNNVIFIYLTWTAIYVYQIIWVLYALALVVRRRPGDPVLISAITLGLYLLALVLQLVLNTVFVLEVSFPFLLGVLVSLAVSLSFSYLSLYNNRFIIAKRNLRKTDSLVRGLLQNSVDVYATWAFVSAFLSFAVVLKSRTDPPLIPSVAGSIILVIFITVTFLYVITDITVVDKYSRYTLSPYFLRIWIISFFLPLATNVGLVIVEVLFLTFAICSVIGKLVIIYRWSKTRPLVPDSPGL